MDDLGVYYSDNFGFSDENQTNERNFQDAKKRFKEFIRQFHEGNYVYCYRDQLKHHYNLKQYWLEVSLEDVSSFDDELADQLYKKPAEYLPLFEDAAREVADEVTRPRPEGEEDVHDIQITLKSEANAHQLRDLKSEHISKLVKIPGIVIAASNVQAKATTISIQCRSCKEIVPKIRIKPGLDGYNLPRRCNADQATGQPRCPVDPYFILPDKCECIDFQILKLQESPDHVPHGEMPRHLQLYCDRNLCERVVPGNRVTVIGIYSIKKISQQKKAGGSDKVNIGIRNPYIRVVGISVTTDGAGRSTGISFTPEEEETFRYLSSGSNVLDRLVKSIAPSIYGCPDIKKAIACMLFGGSRKRLPDGLTRRGDINILLLGDPGTAKSQLLKFVEKVAPVGIYTSGKGSSAAGLTASVIREPHTRNFIMEGGAMVLADGGVVCIDEFDKMREDDRVAIHEAMEQQTISIAKAGITTTLNSRCAVFAAANSVFGRWDESKAEENIDFMPTILSRFDMIFIVKDEHDEKRDTILAKHVMGLHMNASHITEDVAEGELSLGILKKYIAYCRAKCGPRLSPEAADKLKNHYVVMRNSTKDAPEKKSTIPITVRQLEAVVRISESLAKMELQPFVTDRHVNEALRLFQVSTLDAAHSGSLSGAEGFTTDEEHQMLLRIEKQLKKRFAIGSQVSEMSIIQDFIKQKYPERAVYKVLYFMIRRGELQHRMQRKMLYRIK